MDKPIPTGPRALTTLIPLLGSTAPAILIPIKGDFLLSPFTPPPTRIEQLTYILNHLQTHYQTIRENHIRLFRQEAARTIQHYKATEVEFLRTPGNDEIRAHTATEEDLERMIVNMEGVLDPARAMEGPDALKMADFSNCQPNTPREECIDALMRALSLALAELRGLEQHIVRTRDIYVKELEVEKATQAA